jgi:hypothetical protein
MAAMAVGIPVQAISAAFYERISTQARLISLTGSCRHYALGSVGINKNLL